ncbi:PH domain-containing protein [Steroidobacter sp. S1-65]|uniref:PH domain-containing protein n=1 Tax=Steroidobacter gossypii TaxID=2805490 RepID=A0ABS1X1U6_9GAMM|nr:PH domain-containing protein [Steroidobacter gossypii]MBM0107206.1 PH domain-containing protein [Steroidobacter gossypii]
MASDSNFQPTQRLHGLSWLFGLTGAIRQLVVPLIALLFFNVRDDTPGPFGPWIVPIIVTALLIRAVWVQLTFRYGFSLTGLVIHEGAIFRNVRHIEYARIENIDTERGPLHRLLGVAEVRVQTSTGGKPEASISVLGLPAVQEMRERVFSEVRPAEQVAADSPPEQTLLHLSIDELVRHGLIDNRGMILIAAAFGVLHETGIFVLDPQLLERLLESPSAAGLAALGLMMQIALGALTILAVVLAVRMLSVILAIVTLYDFKLTRVAGDLRARYGLFTRVALTLRTRRIQAVHQTESLLHRWFKRVSLSVDLAGDGGGGEGDNDSSRMRTRWLAPVCPAVSAPELIAAALPSLDWSHQPDWQPLAAGARGRIFRKTLAWSVLILTLPAIWYLREGAAFVVVSCVPLAWMHAHLYVKHTRWALAPDAVLFRSGWLKRRLAIVPRDRVQTLAVEASPFDRRSRMASIYVDTAGASSMAAGIRIRYLGAETAEQLASALYRTAGATAP